MTQVGVRCRTTTSGGGASWPEGGGSTFSSFLVALIGVMAR